MDAAMLGALGTIAVGIAAAGGALVGKRGENRANHSGVVLTGYGGLVNELQEERADLREKLANAERALADAYAELARERDNVKTLQAQITDLHREIEGLRQRITELEGQTT